SHGELRPSQVQNAERSDGDRPALPRGLDVLRRTAAAIPELERRWQRRSELLHMGRSVRRARAGQEYANQHRQRLRGVARPKGWAMGETPRAVSKWLLHQVDGRPNRRRQRRLEGTRPLGDSEYACAVPYGDWKGDDEQGDSLPAPAEPVGTLVVWIARTI